MSEEAESRKPRTPNFDRVIDAIERGDYDEKIIELHRALAARQDVLKAQVLEQVRQVFGNDAKIVSTKSMEPMKPIPGLEGDEGKVIVEVDENNPFVKKAERNEEATRSAPPPPVTSATADQIDEDKVTRDPLENVEGGGDAGLPISEVEKRMMDGERITDLEHRGAIIGGLSARDIAD